MRGRAKNEGSVKKMHAGYAFIFGGGANEEAQPKPKLPTSAGFEPNAFYERVLELRRDRPTAFDSLAPVTKQALYAYETAKREHTRLEAIRDEPQAA